MKSILTFILATFLLFPLQAQEKVYTVDNLPKVHLQNKMQYVCNPAGILSQAACDSIDSMLYALEQQTGIETVVAVVPSIGEEDCFNFCHQLLRDIPKIIKFKATNSLRVSCLFCIFKHSPPKTV